jgi:DNA-binding MarR family transcriptional regulator
MAELEHELRILEAIDQNPDVTQANLAVQLGVAVGSVNWYVKRLINKGYVKVTHLQRRKLHYFLTPSGLALKLELTRSYMDVSLRVYRELRLAAQRTLAEVRARGYDSVVVDGQDEAVEILRLTCMEEQVAVAADVDGTSRPAIRADGVGFTVAWPPAEAVRRDAGEAGLASEPADD